ncbi:hypothetical protein Snas_4025 [Stackebrandtia nassauensis DSM 44728]|uniref:Acyltransferase n=1 Tax=Stackebrandtia nassauensis (strain DSM 44728 / CIP 108903 / NRRL B-16338 / NBRC 102104 / LLR-40K-21) TaxID=446470 RepID=D3PZZ0_STANL|nr:hypothetical protein Snas_4025 [Stackebrandtia nassauensis DSM 44728]
MPLPSAAELDSLLTGRLGCDPIDAAAVAAARPDPDADPELWWVMERCYRHLLADMGGIEMLLWPQLPDKWGATGRFVHLYALLAAIPETLAYNRSRGIEDEITWATLSNVAEKLRLNRARFGVPGLEVAHWFTLHFRGAIHRLGRLEFAPERAGEGFPDVDAGDLVLGVHIPQDGGPMSPDACAASIAWAREFFPHHFGDRFASRPLFVCSSWLLDPKLAEVLRPDANIVAFQKLFELLPAGEDASELGEKDVLRFVFDQVGDTDLASLPRDSTLRRVLAEGFAEPRGWQVRTGWFR